MSESDYVQLLLDEVVGNGLSWGEALVAVLEDHVGLDGLEDPSHCGWFCAEAEAVGDAFVKAVAQRFQQNVDKGLQAVNQEIQDRLAAGEPYFLIPNPDDIELLTMGEER